MKLLCGFLSVALSLAIVNWPTTSWAITYDEGVDGDLSDIAASPTAWGTLDVGANPLTASTVDGDYDHVAFTVAPGTQLDSIVLTSFSPSQTSFTGLQSGAVWTAGVGASIDPELLLGYTHFGTFTPGASVGDNILVPMSTAFEAIGFSLPLSAGTYNMLLQERGTPEVTYTMTYNVSLVPEPSSLLLIVMAGCMGCMISRNR